MLLSMLIFVLSFVITNTPVLAENSLYSDVTSNQKIINTLNVLKKHDADSRQVLNVILGNNVSHKPMKIMFYNLASMGSDFAGMDAVACKKNNSDIIYILINSVHQNAPEEAIASLLAHETIHQDEISSIEEEVAGWTNEAKAWASYVANNAQLSRVHSELVNRMNTISSMYTASASNIERKVSSISGYAVLPKYSPGFGF
jgi:hypothetical protein